MAPTNASAAGASTKASSSAAASEKSAPTKAGNKDKKKSEPPKEEAPPAEEEAAPEAAPEEPLAEPAAKEEPSAASVSAPPEATAPIDFKSEVAFERNRRPLLAYLDFGFRWDSGNFSRDESVGQNQQNQDTGVDAWGPMIHAALLGQLSDKWRLGGAFGYGGTYDLNNDGTVLGQLLTLDMRAELTSHMAGRFWLLIEPRAGLSIILPSGFMQERIDANQRFGFDTMSGPRFGFLAGGALGARYMATSWFSVRATVSYEYTMHFLLNTQADGELVTASQKWVVGASRLGGSLGVEAAF